MTDEELAVLACTHIVKTWEGIPKAVDDFCHKYGEHYRKVYEKSLRDLFLGTFGGDMELYETSKAFLDDQKKAYEEQVRLSNEINDEIIKEEEQHGSNQ